MIELESRASRIPSLTHSLSIFVAAYNEIGNLGPTVEVILRALSISVEDFEIIVVDDGSTDGTYELADELARKYPNIRAIHNRQNMGLGYSYIRAIQEATKGSFVFIPGDNTWP